MDFLALAPRERVIKYFISCSLWCYIFVTGSIHKKYLRKPSKKQTSYCKMCNLFTLILDTCHLSGVSNTVQAFICLLRNSLNQIFLLEPYLKRCNFIWNCASFTEMTPTQTDPQSYWSTLVLTPTPECAILSWQLLAECKQDIRQYYELLLPCLLIEFHAMEGTVTIHWRLINDFCKASS